MTNNPAASQRSGAGSPPRGLAALDQFEVPIIGLSATPWTKGLGSYFNKLIVANTIKDMISQKTLAPFRVFAPAHPDLKGVRTVAGDYHEGDLYKAMGKAKLVADVVESWKKFGDNRPTIVFAVNRAHAVAVLANIVKDRLPDGSHRVFSASASDDSPVPVPTRGTICPGGFAPSSGGRPEDGAGAGQASDA